MPAVTPQKADKGAFKDLPIELQPNRIPLGRYKELATAIRERFGQLGDVFVIDATKKFNAADSAGDADIIFSPTNRDPWRQDLVRAAGAEVLGESRNEIQLMLVSRGLIPNGQYMLDFILSKPETFESKSFYYGFGPAMSTVLGAFARSLGYKLTDEGLAHPVQRKGNYSNILITSKPDEIAQILGLDPAAIHEDRLYTPEDVAAWVLASPRFDTGRWQHPLSLDGAELPARNHHQRDAAAKKAGVEEAMSIVDAAPSRTGDTNDGHRYERRVLGKHFLEEAILRAESPVTRPAPLLTGDDVMSILGLRAGPEVGRLLKEVKDAAAREPGPIDRERAIELLNEIAAWR